MGRRSCFEAGVRWGKKGSFLSLALRRVPHRCPRDSVPPPSPQPLRHSDYSKGAIRRTCARIYLFFLRGGSNPNSQFPTDLAACQSLPTPTPTNPAFPGCVSEKDALPWESDSAPSLKERWPLPHPTPRAVSASPASRDPRSKGRRRSSRSAGEGAEGGAQPRGRFSPGSWRTGGRGADGPPPSLRAPPGQALSSPAGAEALSGGGSPPAAPIAAGRARLTSPRRAGGQAGQAQTLCAASFSSA